MKKPSLIQEIKEFKPNLSWDNLKDYGIIIFGGILQALAMRFFLVPAHLVSGGISGLAQIVDYFIDFPIGTMILLGNVPLFIIGFRYLGAMRFALRTAVAVLTFSFFTNLFGRWIPDTFTNDLILQSLYGGVIYGIGCGLVYRGKGTSGGSDILCRILNHYTGISISQGYLLTDSIVVLAGGFIFGWDVALYGVAVIYISGIAAEAIAEGTNRFRTAFIITNCPDHVTKFILVNMERGVTVLPSTGGFTGKDRPMLFCTLTASEIPKLKAIVAEADSNAFMVVGQANEALGEGFTPFRDN